MNSAPDDFEVETNAPSEDTLREQLGIVDEPAKAAPAVEASAAKTDDAEVEETPTEKAARERDEAGRFKAKPAEKTEEPAKVAKPVDDDKTEKPRNRRDDPTEAVKTAIGRQRAAERERDEFRARLDALERQRQPKPAAAAQTFPSFEEYSTRQPDATLETWMDARDAWRDDRRDREASQRAARAQAQHAREGLKAKVSTDIDAAIKADPNFLNQVSDDVLDLPTFDTLKPGEKPTPWHVIGEELLRADKPAAMLRYFSDHPEDLQRLATLPPRDITRQMAIYEARLDAVATDTARSTPVLSRAKPPVRSVTGASPVASTDDPPDDSADFDTHKRYWDALERKGRGR